MNTTLQDPAKKMEKSLYDILAPSSRAHALGVQVCWTLPEQGIPPALFNLAVLKAQVPEELLTDLREATPQEVFSIAMKYVDTRYTVGKGMRRISRQNLHTAKASESATDKPALSTVALNITQVASNTKNQLLQAGVISLNPVTGVVDFDYSGHSSIQAQDYQEIDRIVETVTQKVENWSGKYTREGLNKFLGRLLSRSMGFHWVIKGNSWFVPNPEFGHAIPALSPSNPVEQVVAVAKVIKELNDKNVIQITPIFPDPCSDVLSAHLEVQSHAKRALEVNIKTEIATLRAVVAKGKNARLGSRRASLDKLKSQADLYGRILGAELGELRHQLEQAEKALAKRAKLQTALPENDEVLADLW